VTLAVSWDLLALSGLAGLAAALAVFILGCLLLAVVLAGWWLWRVARYLRRRLAIRRDPMYYGRTR
jgi:uncharacterized iron-regulated membrane protein